MGATPPSSASPPPWDTPDASAASSIGPDSRVSRMISTCGRSARASAAAARPSATASSALSASPATPRTPSVPNSFLATQAPKLTLRELRPLAGLLEPRLATLLGARVAGEHAAALELAAQLGIDLDKRAGDAVADGVGLPDTPPPWTRTLTSTWVS